MSKYTLFHIPPLSFYSTDLYRDMAFNKKGSGFWYLFLLLAVCCLILVIVENANIGAYLDKYAPVLSQFPDVTITDGQVSMRESQPYYIDDPESGRHFAVIDTTGAIRSLDQTEARLLLTRTSLIFRVNKFETRHLELKEVQNMVVNRKLLTSWIDMFKSYFAFFIYPFVLLALYIYRIIQMLIYAAIGLLFASICKVELEYTQLLRLSVVAVTPAIIINTLLWTTGIILPFSGFMYFILTMVYLFLGIKATTEDREEKQIE